MMGRQTSDQSQLFYLFNLERRIPAGHLLRRINPIVTGVLMALREKLAPYYSEIGRPSIDPELMLRMLIVGYCYGIRFERRLCMTGIGPVGVRQPRIRDREAAAGERIRFNPTILPPYARRTKSLEVLIPILT